MYRDLNAYCQSATIIGNDQISDSSPTSMDYEPLRIGDAPQIEVHVVPINFFTLRPDA